MNIDRHPTTLATLAAALSLTLLTPPALAADAAKAPARPGNSAYERWLGQQPGAMQRLNDESALRNLMVAYARGNVSRERAARMVSRRP